MDLLHRHTDAFVAVFIFVQVAVAVMVSWLIFRNPISAINAVGCSVTLVGCTFYGYVRHKLPQQPPGTPRTPRTPRSRMELLPLVNDKLDDKVWLRGLHVPWQLRKRMKAQKGLKEKKNEKQGNTLLVM